MTTKKKMQLPKSILDMKFMKRTKERLERELENTQDHDNLYSKIITNEMRHATTNYITEHSFIFRDELLQGRLSFKGMNPEIERLMEIESNKNKPPEEDMQKDVSDEVLAKKMAAFNKRKRQSKSPAKYVVSKKKKQYN